MHEINLTQFNLRTDLIIDDINLDNYSKIIRKNITEKVFVEEINIESDEEEIKYQKSKGIYKTITFDDITDKDNLKLVQNTFKDEIVDMLSKNNIKEEDSVLIIGLGNIKLSPDALGPKSINNILVTRHLFSLGKVEKGYRSVCTLTPGVTGETGIETKDKILSIINTIKPNFIIIIDSLATKSIDRLNKTIQITNSGIIPGSGVDNSRKELNQKTLGIPVIAIGVPTIIDSSVIVADTITYMLKKFSYEKNNINNKKDKLKTKIDYRNFNKELSLDDKKLVLGIVGTLDQYQLMNLVIEVLNPIEYNYMVTPKEIDLIIDKLSLIIGNGLNQALHSNST